MNEIWDRRFLELAKLVSTWSKDPSTQCGAVIVRPDKTICSTGYNGFPMGIDDVLVYLNNREEKYPRIIHAEMNAILFAKENINVYSMYCYPGGQMPSCPDCTKHIIQTGIKRVVHFYKENENPRRNGGIEGLRRSQQMYNNAGVEIVRYNENI